MYICGNILLSQNGSGFINILNTDEVEFSKFMYSIILQCAIIVIFYDFNLVQYGRILYIGITIIFIVILFNTATIRIQNNITVLLQSTQTSIASL
jgi:hypothetical protein